ncbi:hypothetical protein LTR84_007937 [Exophiala bonariae]|uniref:EthD domain-containing protein n=1 Tax=Exophiala bonariae TaxID=1690606 RepID=A0AAV9NQK3_9EURO|nr:hypothetical protein LTR84_007937 [Exophiala bonariae]
MAKKTQVFRVSIYLKRKEGLSVEEFNRYWSEIHGPLVRPLIQKYGILKYTQYHTSDTLQQSAIDAYPDLKSLSLTPYDGVAEFIVKDMADIRKSQEDPFYLNEVRNDEANFFDVSGAHWTIGWEEVYVEDNKLVPESQIRLNAP